MCYFFLFDEATNISLVLFIYFRKSSMLTLIIRNTMICLLNSITICKKNPIKSFLIILMILFLMYEKVIKSEFSQEQASKKMKTSGSKETLKPKACIVLVKKKHYQVALRSLDNFEKNCNSKFSYSYLVFNDQNFTDEFMNEFKKRTSSSVEFIVLSNEFWSLPTWFDQRP